MSGNSVVLSVHARVRTALERSGTAGRSLVVAVSGGPDSLALLHALVAVRDRLNLRLHGAHLDHGLRGAASASDAEFAGRTFRRLGVPCTVERADVGAFRTAHRVSLEVAAREVRYAFLARVASGQRAEAVVLGHTADDQVETVLMHLVRGSGLTGLRGMEAVSRREIAGVETTLLRPLLSMSREETVEYCRASGLRPRLDESNLSGEMTRNRIRSDLLPLLETFNPAIRDAIIRLSRTAGRDLELLESATDAARRLRPARPGPPEPGPQEGGHGRAGRPRGYRRRARREHGGPDGRSRGEVARSPGPGAVLGELRERDSPPRG